MHVEDRLVTECLRDPDEKGLSEEAPMRTDVDMEDERGASTGEVQHAQIGKKRFGDTLRQ